MSPTEWNGIVEEHSPLVWRVAHRLLASRSDAADCMQETFLAAWKIAARQPVKNWPGLLQHLATARALDHLRRRIRQGRQVEKLDLAELPSRQNGPAVNAELSELASQLRAALAELPPRLSEIYCLRHLNGMSYEEIASELNMTENAVGVALHRATQRLRAAMTPVVIDVREQGRSL